MIADPSLVPTASKGLGTQRWMPEDIASGRHWSGTSAGSTPDVHPGIKIPECGVVAVPTTNEVLTRCVGSGRPLVQRAVWFRANVVIGGGEIGRDANHHGSVLPSQIQINRGGVVLRSHAVLLSLSCCG